MDLGRRKRQTMGSERAKEFARQLFNRQAVRFETTLAGKHSARMKKEALACLKESPKGALLDVGCGPGLLLATLADRPELSLAGLDIAPEMIRIAAERLGKRAEIKLGDAESLAWNDASFDYVFCVNSFHHYPNPELVLNEFHRVLRPHGRLVLADPTAPLPILGILNLIAGMMRMGGMRLYDKRRIIALFKSRRFQLIDWRDCGSWGFVAAAQSL
jgi:ubiquinone/menaquinone biosynthesis C-methylase UbiE